MKVFVFLSLFLTTLFFEVGNGCNSHYGGYGFMGDHDEEFMGHHHHGHMNVHSHGMHHHHGGGYGGYHGMGLMDSLFRTDIGGGGHHHHHSSHLIPTHRHRHVHRVHRRSVHSIRSRTTST